MFQTAFYLPNAGQANDLGKFSTGDYINPASLENQSLAPFARNTQGQARFAKVYARVEQWNASAAAGTHEAVQEDVDLDGLDEYLLFNSRVFAVFEKKGGRMTGAWLRDASGKVWQVAGNFASYGDTDTEDEGLSNETAYRTSGFKDWYSLTGTTGSSAGVNADYAVAPVTGAKGWTFSIDGVSKTILLTSATQGELAASYTLSGPSKLSVRFGLSPNLLDLMRRGHEGLTSEVVENNTRVSVANASGSEVVRAWVEAPQINTAAVDTAATTTVQRRNQAQTHQVEVELTGTGPHLVTLGFDHGSDAPTVTDGIPDTWWEANSIPANERLAAADRDGDGLNNLQEYVLVTDPNVAGSTWRASLEQGGEGFQISFPTAEDRVYTVKSCDNLPGSDWNTAVGEVTGDGLIQTVTDPNSPGKTARFYRVDVRVAP